MRPRPAAPKETRTAVRSTHDDSDCNQSTPFVDVNLFDSDRGLRDALRFNAPKLDTAPLSRLGAEAGSAQTRCARAAGQHPRARVAHARPLRPSRRPGRVPPELSRVARWRVAPRPARHAVVARGRRAPAARRWFHVWTAGRAVGVVPGVDELCGHAGAARQRRVVRRLAHAHRQHRVRPALRAAGAEDRASRIGMGMTEKQGGSDVRANTTRAERRRQRRVGPALSRITGHKWFFSAPMCDAFLVLAQAASGLSCFFLPRWLPDGTPNVLRIQRLKDKLGNKANASSEVEFDRRRGLAGRRGRPRRAADPGDGRDHAPRLRTRHGGADAPGVGAGVAPLQRSARRSASG